MPFIPKSEIEERELAAEGWHLIRIKKCEKKPSKNSGEMMYNWTIVDAKTREFIGYDSVMISGKGARIGIGKLMAVGLAEDLGDGYDYAEPEQCEGVEAWAYIYHHTYDGKKSCKVDISFGIMGYQDKNSPPIQDRTKPQEQRSAAPVDDDLVPF